MIKEKKKAKKVYSFAQTNSCIEFIHLIECLSISKQQMVQVYLITGEPIMKKKKKKRIATRYKVMTQTHPIQ